MRVSTYISPPAIVVAVICTIVFACWVLNVDAPRAASVATYALAAVIGMVALYCV